MEEKIPNNMKFPQPKNIPCKNDRKSYLQKVMLTRMGSFKAAPKINNVDSQDDGFKIPKGLNITELLQHVNNLRGAQTEPLLTRYFIKPPIEQHRSTVKLTTDDITDRLRSLNVNPVTKFSDIPSSQHTIRFLQWNILSQTLGQFNDNFVCCPDAALTWEYRKYLIIQEILQNCPDIICLQEVDHFKFLQNILATQNYEGIFYPKPDSPCLYIEGNNGPDGCAFFYKSDKFQLKNFETRILEVWHVQSNQVAIVANLLYKPTGVEICVCTTHLKARNGTLLAKLRNEQGRDLMNFVKQHAGDLPIIMCGDFNAEPIEPVYTTILTNEFLKLSSAYSDMRYQKQLNENSKTNLTPDEALISENCNAVEKLQQYEPPYTTWKIREDGEVCHTIDYVFYTKDKLKVTNCLEFPNDEEVGKNRTPSLQYPSDHFSLVCDFEIL